MTTAQELLSLEFVSVDLTDTVAQLLGKCARAGTHAALVFDGKEYLGVVEKRFLVTKRIDPSTMKLSNLIKKRSKTKTPFYVPVLSPNDTLLKICKLFSTSGSHTLPVISDKKVLGIVTASALARVVVSNYKTVACDKLASMKLLTAKPKDTIAKTLTTLSTSSIDHLPIVNGNQELVGMVALSDILEHPEFWSGANVRMPRTASHGPQNKSGYRGERTSLLSLPIQNVMTTKNLCVAPSKSTVSQALVKMLDAGVCSIILVEGKKPVGILTLNDVLVDFAKR